MDDQSWKLASSLSSISANASKNNYDVTSLKTDISDIQTSLTAKADVSALNSSISSLMPLIYTRTDNVTFNTSISLLTARLNSKADASALDSSISSLTSLINVKTDNLAFNTSISLLTSQMTSKANLSDFNDSVTSLTSLTSQVGTLPNAAGNNISITSKTISVVSEPNFTNITTGRIDLGSLSLTSVDGGVGKMIDAGMGTNQYLIVQGGGDGDKMFTMMQNSIYTLGFGATNLLRATVDPANMSNNLITFTARTLFNGTPTFAGSVTFTGTVTVPGNGSITSKDGGACTNYSRGPGGNNYMLLGSPGDGSAGVEITSSKVTVIGNFVNSSDQRKKENVQPIANALESISQLRGVNFDWINTGEADSGVIAQEVETVLPQLVSTDRSGFKGVSYLGLIPYLIEAVKALNERVKALEKLREVD